MAVYFEVLRRLRGNPKLMKEFQTRGGEGREEQVKAWLEQLYAGGAVRNDVTVEDVANFVNVVANGIALATSLGLKLDAEALLKLVHHGLDPQS
jgi:hypothetical protein